jgi:hypothetical protein
MTLKEQKTTNNSTNNLFILIFPVVKDDAAYDL